VGVASGREIRGVGDQCLEQNLGFFEQNYQINQSNAFFNKGSFSVSFTKLSKVSKRSAREVTAFGRGFFWNHGIFQPFSQRPTYTILNSLISFAEQHFLESPLYEPHT